MATSDTTPSSRPQPIRKPRKKAFPKVKAVYRLPQGLQAEDMFPDWKDMGATLPEVYFAVEYLTNGFDAVQAFSTVFPAGTRRKATWGGAAYLRRPTVQALLSAYTEAWLRGRIAYLEKEIMDTTVARAFYDPSMFLNPDGSPAFDRWEDIPAVYRRCIEGIDVKFWGKDANRQSITYTLANRSDSLKQLSQILSLIKDGMAERKGEASTMTPDTEMLLSSIFAQGRQVDRRPPAERRAELAAPVEVPVQQESTVIRGLG
jgi:hypothetical protein